MNVTSLISPICTLHKTESIAERLEGIEQDITWQ